MERIAGDLSIARHNGGVMVQQLTNNAPFAPLLKEAQRRFDIVAATLRLPC